MKTKRLTLESFKSIVKRIIKEEMNQNDERFHRENVIDLIGQPIRLVVTNLRTNESKNIEGTINNINDYEGQYSPSGFWLNPQKTGMYVMYNDFKQDSRYGKWVDGNSHASIEIKGATSKDKYILERIKNNAPDYSNVSQLEESKKRRK